MEDGPFRRASTPPICRRAEAATGFRCARRCRRRDRDAAILARLQQLTALRLGHVAVLPAQMGRGGISSGASALARGFRSESARRHEKRTCARRRRACRRSATTSACRTSDVLHIHGTSGTTGRPTAFAIGRDDWDAIANAHARIMWGMGIRPGDTVFVAAIFSLYMGSWGALAGAERLARQGVSLRRGRARNDGARARVARPREAGRVLRDAVLRAAPRRGRAARKARPARFRPEDDVLLRRARRIGAGRPRPDRSTPTARALSTAARWPR